MNSEAIDLVTLLANKAPSYSSAYELFPQFLFRNAKPDPNSLGKLPEKIHTQKFDLEDFPELQATTYEHHPMMYPRFYYNTTVFMGEKERIAPKVETPQVQPPEPTSIPATSATTAPAGVSAATAEASQVSQQSPAADDDRVKQLETAVAEWKAKAEQYYQERDPAIVERERQLQIERELKAKQEAEERRLEAERIERERILEAERVERERIAELKRLEEERRIKKEQERARKIKEREEYYKTYDFDPIHFRYYNLTNMDDVNLYQLYVFTKSDKTLDKWEKKVREEILRRSSWKVTVSFPYLRPQIRLLTNPKYIDLGSIHRVVGNFAKLKRFYTQYQTFPVPTHSTLKARVKNLEVFHNF